MRTLKLLSVLALVVLAGLVVIPKEALAALNPSRILNLYVLNKLLVGNGTEANAITKVLAGPLAGTTIDFASTVSGRVFSSSIVVTGAVAGDVCVVGPPYAATNLKAKFGCYVDAADSVKVWFEPGDTAKAQVTFVTGTPSTVTATVTAGSICTCSSLGTTAAIAAAGCAWSVTSTTLTLTGPNSVTNAVVYDCAAAVDPASGLYFVRVTSQQ